MNLLKSKAHYTSLPKNNIWFDLERINGVSEDFTEQRYGEILDLAASRFSFHPISRIPDSKGTALWRHDIDFSPQRAHAMAKMEAERGIVASYYVQPSSRFYSVFEPEVSGILQEIREMGHTLGLHFDPSIYPPGSSLPRLLVEKELLAELTKSEIETLSLHNPTTYDSSTFEAPVIEGMVNATHTSLRERFTYCSDSNSSWRFTPLEEVLGNPDVSNIYILTHPVWWTAEDMMPRDKVKRSIEGRAVAELRYYDALLEAHNRPNLGK